MSLSSSNDTLEYQGKYEYDYEAEGSEGEAESERRLKESVDDFDGEWRGETEEAETEAVEKTDRAEVKKDVEEEEEEEEDEQEETAEKKRAQKKVIFSADSESPSAQPSIKEQRTESEEASRRKTIFDLDSFGALANLAQGLAKDNEEEEVQAEADEDDGIRFSDTMGIEGIARIDLSALTQKIVGVVIDENVTTEFPWLYVRKEIIEDNLDLHSDSSDFLPVKNYIERYPAPRILLGYAPTTKQNQGQFYICLTEEARDAVARLIEARRLKQQDKVRNAVVKTAARWSHLGSGHDVKYMSVHRARPLYEIQVERSASELQAAMSLSDRKSGDERDGYVEVIAYRQSFSNVKRLLVDKEVKAVACLEDSEAQTILATQVNSSCQCQLNVEACAELQSASSAKEADIMLQSLKSRIEDVCEQIECNSLWDVYANDYAKLAQKAVGAPLRSRGSSEYVERQSYYEGKSCSGRVINDLAWHPQCTGIAAAVYTDISKSENLVGPKPFKQDSNENSVLIWSLDDSLGPKLILQSKRQVCSVSFHPRNGNIVVGGCVNGQIVIWDITGKIEQVESVLVKTPDQLKYETVLKGMSGWMKDTLGPMYVRPTVSSSLQYSQKAQITRIDWLSAYKAINERGILQNLADEALSSQFAASSLDGSIAFYDLDWRPAEDKNNEAPKKKKKSTRKPAALLHSISPYKILDNIFKPLYALITQYDNETRNALVTAMSLRGTLLRKQQVAPFPRGNQLTERKYYEILADRQAASEDQSIPSRIFIGTIRGECGLVSWQGYDFSTGISLTKEMCKWIWRKQLHDGPVIHAVRSTHLRDLILTIGGKIFAVWREDFDQPILWRKSESRYTSGCWAADRPSVIIVGRNDGTAEIWDLLLKSHEPSATHSLSARIITGIYAHELPLNPHCVGFCDYNGALRIFLAPAVSCQLSSSSSDLDWMRRFVDREVQRIQDFVHWRKAWREMNDQTSEDQQNTPAEQDDSKKVSAAEENLKDEALKAQAANKAKAKKRKNLLDEMQAKWVTRELGRMQVAILTKKGLREEELERRIEPVLRMKREARERDLRRQQFLDKAPELFDDAVASNFPQQRGQLLASDDMTAQASAATAISHHLPSLPDFIAAMDKASDEDIIREYEQLESEALAKIRQRQELDEQHELEFSWRKLLTEAIKRRRSMDVNLKARQAKSAHLSEDYDLSSRSSLQSFESRR